MPEAPHLSGSHPPKLLARLRECLGLRVKDVDFLRGEIRVRRGKGGVDRVTPLPLAVQGALAEHLARCRLRHEREVAGGRGRVSLPGALERKLPGANAEWPWQWVFPASRVHRDPASGEERRYHVHESAIQRAVQTAVRRARIANRGAERRLSRQISARRAPHPTAERRARRAALEHHSGGYPEP